MKKRLFAAILILTSSLSIGYYSEVGHTETYTHLFIKKAPTLKVRFENIFANYKDHKKLNDLTTHERRQVIDYCKYRLGIVTQLKTQEELERCKKY